MSDRIPYPYTQVGEGVQGCTWGGGGRCCVGLLRSASAVRAARKHAWGCCAPVPQPAQCAINWGTCIWAIYHLPFFCYPLRSRLTHLACIARQADAEKWILFCQSCPAGDQWAISLEGLPGAVGGIGVEPNSDVKVGGMQSKNTPPFVWLELETLQCLEERGARPGAFHRHSSPFASCSRWGHWLARPQWGRGIMH